MHRPGEFGRQRFHVRLGALFRIQAGVAVLLAVIILICQLPPDASDRSVSPVEFIFVTSLVALATYAASRRVFSRFTSPLLAVLSAAIAGGGFTRPKVDNPAELVVFGIGVALAWLLSLGWLDTSDD